jgi:hypothetical protein
VRLQRRHVRGQVAPRQQAAVDARVQGLDAAVQHLGEAGDLGHLGHRQAGVGQQPAVPPVDSSARRSGMQRAGEFDDAGLVGDREQAVSSWPWP